MSDDFRAGPVDQDRPEYGERVEIPDTEAVHSTN
jgi:hypothetical protein